MAETNLAVFSCGFFESADKSRINREAVAGSVSQIVLISSSIAEQCWENWLETARIVSLGTIPILE